MNFWTLVSLVSLFIVKTAYSVTIVIEVDDGAGWSPATSKAVSYGSRIKLRCMVGEDDTSTKNITLYKRTDQTFTSELLKSDSNGVLIWVIDSAIFDSSGIYECVSKSFSDVLMLHVYKFTDLQSVVVPTVTFEDNVANIRLIRRQLNYQAFADRKFPWLSCSFTVASAHLIEQITVHWEGGLFETTANRTELSTIYSQSILRNASEKSITARLRLNIPTLDSRVYGRYRCVFTFDKSESAIGTVDLKIPPILRLAFDPPPLPPANFSYHFTCKDPPCAANLDTRNAPISTAANWTGACQLVAAHPPVSASGLIWAWNEPQWASYAIRRVFEVGKSTYLSEVSAGDSSTLNKDALSPWQVLEQRRRRRRRDMTTEVEEDLYSESAGNRPPVPVIFWCWTQNTEGQTAVWWPGPSPYVSGFWASIWWPILGVALELASLCMVFGFFRYCHRKRQLRAYVPAPGEEQVSFGLSRLLDSDDPRYPGPQQQSSGANSASEIKRISQLGLIQSVPYVRLSDSHAHPDDKESHTFGRTTNSNVTSLGNRERSSGADTLNNSDPGPAGDDLKTPIVMAGHETDEYFWDLDGTAVDGGRKQLIAHHID